MGGLSARGDYLDAERLRSAHQHARRHLRHHEDAEDAVGEAVLRYLSAAEVRNPGAYFSRCLATAMSVVANRRSAELPLIETRDVSARDAGLESAPALIDLERALLGMRADRRRVLLTFALEGTPAWASSPGWWQKVSRWRRELRTACDE